MMKISFVIFSALVTIISAGDEMHFAHCCGFAELLDHEIGSKCNQNVTSDDHKEKFKQRACHLNCIAREMNLVDGNSFNISKFEELVGKMEPNPEGQHFYKNKIKGCEAKIEEMAKHHKDEHHDDSECSKKVFGIMMCLGHQVALECPAAKKIETAECDKQRAWFKKMEEKYENHHGKHK